VTGLTIAPVSSLSQAASFLSGQSQLQFPEALKERIKTNISSSCFSDVKGQTMAKRALEIAASGGHHLLMSGSPGCGKTMLASRFGSLLPELKTDTVTTSLSQCSGVNRRRVEATTRRNLTST